MHSHYWIGVAVCCLIANIEAQSSVCFQTPGVQGSRCNTNSGAGVVQAFTYKNGQCISFVYAGCNGNSNRFTTLAQCQQQCMNTASTGTCSNVRPCPSGQRCDFAQFPARCVTSTVTGTCSSTQPCPFGQSCDFTQFPNRCITGSSGATCSTTQPCPFGQRCDFAQFPARCTTGTNTASCSSAQPCPFGQRCDFAQFPARCVTSTATSNQCFGANEFYTTCGTCERTCANQSPFCTSNCQQGCRCNNGYLRDDSTRQCVLPTQCRQTIIGGTKPGTCPPPTQISSQCFFGTQNQCTSDSQCGGSQKCCSDGCRRACQNPSTTGVATGCTQLPAIDGRCQLTNQRMSAQTRCWSYTVVCP